MVLLFLAGCSGSPGEGTIEKQVAQELHNSDRSDIYRINNFEKLSGHYKKDSTYIADVEYDLVFKKSYEQAAEEAKEGSKDNPLNALGSGMDLFTLKLQYGDFKAGEVLHREERVTLVKTDQGWMLEDR
ncbi:MAG: hypothetical protein P8Y63_09555 [Deltaproteobacteria bacterium]|jgi:hypothetical protein